MGEPILQIESVDSLGGSRKHEAFLRDAETGLLLAHARYNFPQKRNHWHEQVAWLNDISSISGVVSGRVKTSIGEAEAQLYDDTSSITVDTLRGNGKYLIRRIIEKYLPDDIKYLKMPILCRNFEKELKKYYWKLGEDMQSEGLVHAVGAYSDGISFQIRPII